MKNSFKINGKTVRKSNFINFIKKGSFKDFGFLHAYICKLLNLKEEWKLKTWVDYEYYTYKVGNHTITIYKEYIQMAKEWLEEELSKHNVKDFCTVYHKPENLQKLIA